MPLGGTCFSDYRHYLGRALSELLYPSSKSNEKGLVPHNVSNAHTMVIGFQVASLAH